MRGPRSAASAALFKDVPAHELGATAVREAAASLRRRGGRRRRRSSWAASVRSGPDAYNARRVAVAAGLPTDASRRTPSTGSAAPACRRSGRRRWRCAGTTSTSRVAGGDESMSRMPFYDFGARDGYRLGDRDAGRRHRDDADRPVPRHPHGRHRGERRPRSTASPGSDRTSSPPSRSGGPRPTRRGRPSPRRSCRSRSAGASRSPSSVDEHPKPDTTIETLAGLRPAFAAGRHGHRRQRVRDQRRRRRARARRASRRAASAACPDWSPSRPSPRRRWSPS